MNTIVSGCGAYASYIRGCRCEECKSANATYQRERREIRKNKITGDEAWHGTAGGYKNRKCRCQDCNEASRKMNKAWRRENGDRENDKSRSRYAKKARASGRQVQPQRRSAEVLARNELGHKRCISCSEWLEENQYSADSRSTDGLAGRCKPCGRFARYGLTRARIRQMLAEQGNACPICQKELRSFDDFDVDHDHSCCGVIGRCCGACTRGLICKRCNITVIAVLEDVALVNSANDYLKKYAWIRQTA